MLKLSQEAMRGPPSMETVPAATSVQTWMPKQPSTPSIAPSSIMAMAPRAISSAGWKARRTVPQRSSLMSMRMCAAVSSMEMWQSWPQACITPSFTLAYSAPVVSWTVRASISARRRMVLPGLVPSMVASTPVPMPQSR